MPDAPDVPPWLDPGEAGYCRHFFQKLLQCRHVCLPFLCVARPLVDLQLGLSYIKGSPKVVVVPLAPENAPKNTSMKRGGSLSPLPCSRPAKGGRAATLRRVGVQAAGGARGPPSCRVLGASCGPWGCRLFARGPCGSRVIDLLRRMERPVTQMNLSRTPKPMGFGCCSVNEPLAIFAFATFAGDSAVSGDAPLKGAFWLCELARIWFSGIRCNLREVAAFQLASLDGRVS